MIWRCISSPLLPRWYKNKATRRSPARKGWRKCVYQPRLIPHYVIFLSTATLRNLSRVSIRNARFHCNAPGARRNEPIDVSPWPFLFLFFFFPLRRAGANAWRKVPLAEPSRRYRWRRASSRNVIIFDGLCVGRARSFKIARDIRTYKKKKTKRPRLYRERSAGRTRNTLFGEGFLRICTRTDCDASPKSKRNPRRPSWMKSRSQPGDGATRRRVFRKFGFMLTCVIYFVRDRSRPLPRKAARAAFDIGFWPRGIFAGLFRYRIILTDAGVSTRLVFRLCIARENLWRRRNRPEVNIWRTFLTRVKKLTMDLSYVDLSFVIGISRSCVRQSWEVPGGSRNCFFA